MAPSLIDPELELLMIDGHLVLMLTKHVDDLKVGGKREYVII